MNFENLSSDLGFEAWSKEFGVRFDVTVNSRSVVCGLWSGLLARNLVLRLRTLGHKFGASTGFQA